MPDKKITREFFLHGRKSGIGTTAVKLVDIRIKLNRGVLIKGASDNSDDVFMGREEVNADEKDVNCGFRISAGEALMFEIEKLWKIYLVSPTAGQTVYWFAV